jgi:hypothetical protein
MTKVHVMTKQKRSFYVAKDVWDEFEKVARLQERQGETLLPILFECLTVEHEPIWVLGWNKEKELMRIVDEFVVSGVPIKFNDCDLSADKLDGLCLVKNGMGYAFA